MKAIVVVDKNWGIGKDGALLVHLPGDLRYFKEKTLGKVVVMGRPTLESLPGKKPLSGRTTVVMTKDRDYSADCTVCHSMGELFRFLEQYDTEDVFICGGEHIYREFFNFCNEIHVTKIDAEFEADRHFENMDQRADWAMSSEGAPIEENGVSYRFTVYKRR